MAEGLEVYELSASVSAASSAKREREVSKYDEINGGFKQPEIRDDEPDSLLRETPLELAERARVLALPEKWNTDTADNPYKGWSAEQLKAEVERLCTPPQQEGKP